MGGRALSIRVMNIGFVKVAYQPCCCGYACGYGDRGEVGGGAPSNTEKS